MSDTLVNNMSEAFNSVIVEARSKPIISMMEQIRAYLMDRWATNRSKVTPASVPGSAPATAPEFVTHPASASELPAPASATQPAPATASQSTTQNGPPPPSTPHEQAT